MLDRSRIANALGWLAIVALLLGVGAIAAWLLRQRVQGSSRPTSKDLVAAPVNPAPALNRGKLLFQVHCVRCHGTDGHGDGPDAANLQPPPRDFASQNWRFSSSPESIRKVIVEGIPGTSMYPFGGSLSPRELDAVIDHVRSLAPRIETRPALEAAGFEPASRPALAPAVEVIDLAGSPRSLKFDQGRLTLLVFWGTSCAPCQEELPELERLASDFQGQGLDVFPVCVDQPDRAVVKRVARGKFDRFPVFVTTDGLARLRYDIETLPVAALIDRQGNLLGIARGGIDWKGKPARRLIEDLLAVSRVAGCSY